MGLGLRVGAPWPGDTEILEQIEDAIEDCLQDPLLSVLCETDWRDDALLVFLHPAEEPVFFEVEEGMVVCSAKTSTAGPGYHAFLVELLEQIGNYCDLHWIDDDEDRGLADETGYFHERDVRALQAQMNEWLHHFAQLLLQRDRGGGIAIGLPVGFMPQGDFFAASSLGFWERGFFERVAAADEEALVGLGRQFFPWYDEGMGAAFWLRCGLVLMWTRTPWHVPADDIEAALFDVVRECCERAREIDAGIDLPEMELAELARLADADEDAGPPAPGRIGFLRGEVTTALPGGWTIVLPGYFHAEQEEATLSFWFGGRSVHATTFSGDGSAPDLIAEVVTGDDQDVLSFAETGRLGRATVAWDADENAHLLHGAVATDEHLCVLTIRFEDEAHRDWAVATWRSAAPPAA